MGRQTVPIFRALYASKNPPAAFHAARTGMRLGDDAATEVVLHVARSAGSSLQVPAVRELGHGEGSMQVRRVLRELLDDDNELVRVTAYESLLRLGDVTTTQRFDIAGKFKLDLVKSRRGYVIYATQTGAPRIVLFGRDMSVTKPVFFNAPGDLVTANARPVDEKLMVYRKIPRTGTYSDTFKIDFYVRTLIRTLGSRPQHDENDEIMGLGLSYSQVVSVLHRMCREGDIPAKFVLQQPPVLQRISRGTAMGRPDVPIR